MKNSTTSETLEVLQHLLPNEVCLTPRYIRQTCQSKFDCNSETFSFLQQTYKNGRNTLYSSVYMRYALIKLGWGGVAEKTTERTEHKVKLMFFVA